MYINLKQRIFSNFFSKSPNIRFVIGRLKFEVLMREIFTSVFYFSGLCSKRIVYKFPFNRFKIESLLSQKQSVPLRGLFFAKIHNVSSQMRKSRGYFWPVIIQFSFRIVQEKTSRANGQKKLCSDLFWMTCQGGSIIHLSVITFRKKRVSQSPRHSCFDWAGAGIPVISADKICFQTNKQKHVFKGEVHLFVVIGIKVCSMEKSAMLGEIKST